MAKNDIDVSIIIVSYNTKDLTLACVESIYRYEKNRSDFETIVVDNNSSDGSPQFIKSKFPEIVMIENERNWGFAKANNQGIKASKGKVILLLNSDAAFTQLHTLRSFMTKMETFSDVGAIVPRLINVDGTDQASVFYFPTIRRAIDEFWFHRDSTFNKYLPKGDRDQVVEAPVMAAMLLPRSTINKVGLLDENYFMYFEDLDYCRRIYQAGLRIYYCPEIVVAHHHGASGKQVRAADQWKRLIPSSKIYHGTLRHYLITGIIWIGQRVFKK